MLAHWGFQHFPTIYSTLKMSNDGFKFYFHILMPLKFEIIIVNKILLEIRHVIWYVNT